MSDEETLWEKLDKEQRQQEILKRRKNKESWADIADALTGSRIKKGSIWSWANRNIPLDELRKAENGLKLTPTLTEEDQWLMFDQIMHNLFPRLDAVVVHLLTEFKKLQEEQRKIQEEQQKKFILTASFLDSIEERLSRSIKANMTGMVVPASYQASSSSTGMTAGSPPPPPKNVPPPAGSTAPPPPSGSGSVPAPTTIRTDFENMSLEEINTLPPDFLVSLSTIDRGRIQERVKELKYIARLSPEEREDYLEKKRKEKELEEASTGLGDSLKAMLDDSDSLFAKMKRAAEDSEIKGKGTFGQFTTDFIYSYCFSCGKTIRNEDVVATACPFCGGQEELVVAEEEKTGYRYFECLDCKFKEAVNPSFTRGSPVIITSRWKVVGTGKAPSSHDCGSANIRDITASVLTKEDPDKQFAYNLTFLRSYLQSDIAKNLLHLLKPVNDTLQRVPDITTRNEGIVSLEKMMEQLRACFAWLKKSGSFDRLEKSVRTDIEHLLEDLAELNNKDSPQHYMKMNETNQLTAKIEQLMTLFTAILEKTKKHFMI
ncbi:MAG: hypothetical protein ACFFD4_24660 [Candidatus Odinarchaeota archaeon]